MHAQPVAQIVGNKNMTQRAQPVARGLDNNNHMPYTQSDSEQLLTVLFGSSSSLW